MCLSASACCRQVLVVGKCLSVSAVSKSVLSASACQSALCQRAYCRQVRVREQCQRASVCVCACCARARAHGLFACPRWRSYCGRCAAPLIVPPCTAPLIVPAPLAPLPPCSLCAPFCVSQHTKTSKIKTTHIRTLTQSTNSDQAFANLTTNEMENACRALLI
jgi:hypothetical protein